MTTSLSDAALIEAAAALAQSIQTSAEWRELANAQKAPEADSR